MPQSKDSKSNYIIKESVNSHDQKQINRYSNIKIKNIKSAKQVIDNMNESESDDESSEISSFLLDKDEFRNQSLLNDPRTNSTYLISSQIDCTNNSHCNLNFLGPEAQIKLAQLFEEAGLKHLSPDDGKGVTDPEILRQLTSSVNCALEEAVAALTLTRIKSGTSKGVQTPDDQANLDALHQRALESLEEGESLLSLACSSGYYELVQVLLAMNTNIEERGIKGDTTPLMEAASGGYVEIVKLLLEHGADPKAQSLSGNTALTYACIGGHTEVTRLLLKYGADVEYQNENGHTALMEAATGGHVDTARILVTEGRASINAHSNEFKESALTLACYKGNLEMVRFLLEAGADHEHKTEEMHTALMEASMDGHLEVAKLLLDHGAQVNMPPDSFESPLTLAACGGHVELANLLIERGANLEEINDEGYTPLMEAAREGHKDVVSLLLSHGSNVNAQTEETQETALTLSCYGGFLQVADLLIKTGADIELGCNTPLMEASQEGHLDLVHYLLLAGANPHAQTGPGNTALTFAAENGHTDIVVLLLHYGAEIDHESEGGKTPLIKAARNGHAAVVKLLVENGANPNKTTTNNEHTALSLAAYAGHIIIVELLLEYGADPTHKLKDNSTALIEASKNGHTDIVQLLLDFPKFLKQINAEVASSATPALLLEKQTLKMQQQQQLHHLQHLKQLQTHQQLQQQQLLLLKEKKQYAAQQLEHLQQQQKQLLTQHQNGHMLEDSNALNKKHTSAVLTAQPDSTIQTIESVLGTSIPSSSQALTSGPPSTSGASGTSSDDVDIARNNETSVIVMTTDAAWQADTAHLNEKYDESPIKLTGGDASLYHSFEQFQYQTPNGHNYYAPTGLGPLTHHSSMFPLPISQLQQHYTQEHHHYIHASQQLTATNTTASAATTTFTSNYNLKSLAATKGMALRIGDKIRHLKDLLRNNYDLASLLGDVNEEAAEAFQREMHTTDKWAASINNAIRKIERYIATAQQQQSHPSSLTTGIAIDSGKRVAQKKLEDGAKASASSENGEGGAFQLENDQDDEERYVEGREGDQPHHSEPSSKGSSESKVVDRDDECDEDDDDEEGDDEGEEEDEGEEDVLVSFTPEQLDSRLRLQQAQFDRLRRLQLQQQQAQQRYLLLAASAAVHQKQQQESASSVGSPSSSSTKPPWNMVMAAAAATGQQIPRQYNLNALRALAGAPGLLKAAIGQQLEKFSSTTSETIAEPTPIIIKENMGMDDLKESDKDSGKNYEGSPGMKDQPEEACNHSASQNDDGSTKQQTSVPTISSPYSDVEYLLPNDYMSGYACPTDSRDAAGNDLKIYQSSEAGKPLCTCDNDDRIKEHAVSKSDDTADSHSTNDNSVTDEDKMADHHPSVDKYCPVHGVISGFTQQQMSDVIAESIRNLKILHSPLPPHPSVSAAIDKIHSIMLQRPQYYLPPYNITFDNPDLYRPSSIYDITSSEIIKMKNNIISPPIISKSDQYAPYNISLINNQYDIDIGKFGLENLLDIADIEDFPNSVDISHQQFFDQQQGIDPCQLLQLNSSDGTTHQIFNIAELDSDIKTEDYFVDAGDDNLGELVVPEHFTSSTRELLSDDQSTTTGESSPNQQSSNATVETEKSLAMITNKKDATNSKLVLTTSPTISAIPDDDSVGNKVVATYPPQSHQQQQQHQQQHHKTVCYHHHPFANLTTAIAHPSDIQRQQQMLQQQQHQQHQQFQHMAQLQQQYFGTLQQQAAANTRPVPGTVLPVPPPLFSHHLHHHLHHLPYNASGPHHHFNVSTSAPPPPPPSFNSNVLMVQQQHNSNNNQAEYHQTVSSLLECCVKDPSAPNLGSVAHHIGGGGVIMNTQKIQPQLRTNAPLHPPSLVAASYGPAAQQQTLLAAAAAHASSVLKTNLNLEKSSFQASTLVKKLYDRTASCCVNNNTGSSICSHSLPAETALAEASGAAGQAFKNHEGIREAVGVATNNVPPVNTCTTMANIGHVAGPPVATGAATAAGTTKKYYPAIEVDAQTDSNHDTALTLACAGGPPELVELLIKRGSSIEHRDKKGFTPLIIAATSGQANIVQLLLNHGVNIEAQSDRTKDTALSLACSSGRYEVVEVLLNNGAYIEHRNVSDYTPLSLAASGGHCNIIKLLLNHGAEINSRTGSKLGISPLMLAAMNGHLAAVKLLLDMGSDINAQIETNKNTALTLACFQGKHEVVSLFLEYKANIEHRAKTGLTPLMEAASGGFVDVGRVLIEKGADVNAAPVPSSRDTALTIAADKGHYKFVELLVQSGAQIEVKNKKGNSPLWLAANGGHLDVIQFLASKGADIDSQDNRKVSCLMGAFRKGHIRTVRWMVKHVSQFPSDSECMRFINTLIDKDMLKRCHQCMEIIISAKDRQAAEANKNASDLLDELDKEKTREENKKAAAARRREKKRQKKKDKQLKDQEENITGDGESRKEYDDDKEDANELTLVEDKEKISTSSNSSTNGTTAAITKPIAPDNENRSNTKANASHIDENGSTEVEGATRKMSVLESWFVRKFNLKAPILSTKTNNKSIVNPADSKDSTHVDESMNNGVTSLSKRHNEKRIIMKKQNSRQQTKVSKELIDKIAEPPHKPDQGQHSSSNAQFNATSQPTGYGLKTNASSVNEATIVSRTLIGESKIQPMDDMGEGYGRRQGYDQLHQTRSHTLMAASATAIPYDSDKDQEDYEDDKDFITAYGGTSHNRYDGLALTKSTSDNEQWSIPYQTAAFKNRRRQRQNNLDDTDLRFGPDSKPSGHGSALYPSHNGTITSNKHLLSSSSKHPTVPPSSSINEGGACSSSRKPQQRTDLKNNFLVKKKKSRFNRDRSADNERVVGEYGSAGLNVNYGTGSSYGNYASEDEASAQYSKSSGGVRKHYPYHGASSPNHHGTNFGDGRRKKALQADESVADWGKNDWATALSGANAGSVSSRNHGNSKTSKKGSAHISSFYPTNDHHDEQHGSSSFYGADNSGNEGLAEDDYGGGASYASNRYDYPTTRTAHNTSSSSTNKTASLMSGLPKGTTSSGHHSRGGNRQHYNDDSEISSLVYNNSHHHNRWNNSGIGKRLNDTLSSAMPLSSFVTHSSDFNEDEWKEVVRKCKRVVVASNVVARVIGRGGQNINAIRDMSGAHIEIDKQKGAADRNITIRGSPEAIKFAYQLIMALVEEPERDAMEIIQSYESLKPSSKLPAILQKSNLLSFTNQVVLKGSGSGTRFLGNGSAGTSASNTTIVLTSIPSLYSLVTSTTYNKGGVSKSHSTSLSPSLSNVISSVNTSSTGGVLYHQEGSQDSHHSHVSLSNTTSGEHPKLYGTVYSTIALAITCASSYHTTSTNLQIESTANTLTTNNSFSGAWGFFSLPSDYSKDAPVSLNSKTIFSTMSNATRTIDSKRFVESVGNYESSDNSQQSLTYSEGTNDAAQKVMTSIIQRVITKQAGESVNVDHSNVDTLVVSSDSLSANHADNASNVNHGTEAVNTAQQICSDTGGGEQASNLVPTAEYSPFNTFVNTMFPSSVWCKKDMNSASNNNESGSGRAGPVNNIGNKSITANVLTHDKGNSLAFKAANFASIVASPHPIQQYAPISAGNSPSVNLSSEPNTPPEEDLRKAPGYKRNMAVKALVMNHDAESQQANPPMTTDTNQDSKVSFEVDTIKDSKPYAYSNDDPTQYNNSGEMNDTLSQEISHLRIGGDFGKLGLSAPTTPLVNKYNRMTTTQPLEILSRNNAASKSTPPVTNNGAFSSLVNKPFLQTSFGSTFRDDSIINAPVNHSMDDSALSALNLINSFSQSSGLLPGGKNNLTKKYPAPIGNERISQKNSGSNVENKYTPWSLGTDAPALNDWYNQSLLSLGRSSAFTTSTTNTNANNPSLYFDMNFNPDTYFLQNSFNLINNSGATPNFPFNDNAGPGTTNPIESSQKNLRHTYMMPTNNKNSGSNGSGTNKPEAHTESDEGSNPMQNAFMMGGNNAASSSFPPLNINNNNFKVRNNNGNNNMGEGGVSTTNSDQSLPPSNFHIYSHPFFNSLPPPFPGLPPLPPQTNLPPPPLHPPHNLLSNLSTLFQQATPQNNGQSMPPLSAAAAAAYFLNNAAENLVGGVGMNRPSPMPITFPHQLYPPLKSHNANMSNPLMNMYNNSNNNANNNCNDFNLANPPNENSGLFSTNNLIAGAAGNNNNGAGEEASAKKGGIINTNGNNNIVTKGTVGGSGQQVGRYSNAMVNNNGPSSGGITSGINNITCPSSSSPFLNNPGGMSTNMHKGGGNNANLINGFLGDVSNGSLSNAVGIGNYANFLNQAFNPNMTGGGPGANTNSSLGASFNVNSLWNEQFKMAAAVAALASNAANCNNGGGGGEYGLPNLPPPFPPGVMPFGNIPGTNNSPFDPKLLNWNAWNSNI